MQGLKPNTIVQIHRILSRALKVAWKRGKVARNVASLVDAPLGEDVDIEPLSRGEAREILRVAADRRNGARWSVALAVGIRQSEALGLRWRFVDLDAGVSRISRSNCQPSAGTLSGISRQPNVRNQPKQYTSSQWGGWGSNPRPADYESAALTG
jgi:hypothetical protein